MAVRSCSTMAARGAFPITWGGTNFMPPSFDPALGLFFVTARETCATYRAAATRIISGQASFGGVVRRDAEKAYGALRAIDATTGERQVGVPLPDAEPWRA